jgi:hypothetical protein
LFPDARQRPRNAMGAIENRNDNAELRHDFDLRSSLNETPLRCRTKQLTISNARPNRP